MYDKVTEELKEPEDQALGTLRKPERQWHTTKQKDLWAEQ